MGRGPLPRGDHRQTRRRRTLNPFDELPAARMAYSSDRWMSTMGWSRPCDSGNRWMNVLADETGMSMRLTMGGHKDGVGAHEERDRSTIRTVV
jgi:hypothetical protein